MSMTTTAAAFELAHGLDDADHYHLHTPFIGSVTGQESSYGLNGRVMPTCFPDLSHLPLLSSQGGGLLRLPFLYTDMLDCLWLPYKPRMDEQGRRTDEPAICMVCGTIVNAGNRACDLSYDLSNDTNQRLRKNPGECTLHARTCGAGVGVFFFILPNWVLLCRGGRSSKYGALYLDANGETGEGRGQNRPLMLSKNRFSKLEELYLKHNVANEVTRNRVSSDRCIRTFYY